MGNSNKGAAKFGIFTDITLFADKRPRNSSRPEAICGKRPRVLPCSLNEGLNTTCSLHCSSFLGLPFRILNIELVQPKAMETRGKPTEGLKPQSLRASLRGWPLSKSQSCRFALLVYMVLFSFYVEKAELSDSLVIEGPKGIIL